MAFGGFRRGLKGAGSFTPSDDEAAEVDRAFEAAEDGDCPRVAKHLDRGGEYGNRVRAQLTKKCASVRGEGLGRIGSTPVCKMVKKSGVKLKGTYCEKVRAPLSSFAKNSIRTVVFNNGSRAVLIGCPKGNWKPSRKGGHCESGTRAYATLTRVRGKKR